MWVGHRTRGALPSLNHTIRSVRAPHAQCPDTLCLAPGTGMLCSNEWGSEREQSIAGTGAVQLFGADVRLATLLGEFDLFVAFFEAGFAILVEVADAFWARDTLTVVRGSDVLGR